MSGERTGPAHQIHGLLFGHDGKLYAAVGDGARPGRGLLDDAFGGKIIRLNADGSAPSDNPHYDSLNPSAPLSYQWAKGFRNVFDIAQRPGDDTIYAGDNGHFIDRVGRVVRGDNYEWTGYEGGALNDGFWYFGPPAQAPTGMAFAAGGVFPESLQGHLFVGGAGSEFSAGTTDRGKVVWDFPIDADGALRGRPAMLVKYVGSGHANVTGVAYAPDGLLFAEFFCR